MYISVLLGTMNMSGACGCRKKADPLELELLLVVSHHVSSENQTWVLCKTNRCSKLLSYLSAP